MTINAVSESFGYEENASFQRYQDLTFVLGPPGGERYEMLTTIARRSGKSFSEVYGLFVEQTLVSNEIQNLLDQVFSLALGLDLKTNDYILTKQCWFRRQEKFNKFYLFPDDESVEIPALMVFPPKFTIASGQCLTIDVDMQHAQFVSAFIGQTFELDWIDIKGILMETRTELV